jgi:hypothetical protein
MLAKRYFISPIFVYNFTAVGEHDAAVTTDVTPGNPMSRAIFFVTLRAVIVVSI